MNYKKSILFLTAAVLGLQACQSSAEKEGTTTLTGDTTVQTTESDKLRNDSANLNDEETAFIEKAAIGGILEVELGNLATQKTKSKKVMDFAKKMVTDHTQINNDLKTLAASLGVELPGSLPATEQKNLAETRQLEGNEFDQTYMDMMAKDHSKTLDLFNGARKFSNFKLRDFALKTLPILQHHNEMAIGIDSVIMVKKPDSRGDDLPNVDKKHKN